ncbi:MAG: cytochrome C [Acidobacteriota bacterium]|nr:cytochrome C [Acidobacteriota bacterium]
MKQPHIAARTLLGSGLALLALVVCLCPDAKAVPSFTRQTGLQCAVCHSNPPELTAFGRKFKLEGYTLTDKKADTIIEDQDKDLKLNRYFPISVMLLLSNTTTNKPIPGAQNSTAGFPQALSLFLAGELAPHFGALVQVTYSNQSDHFSLDNTDIRYAKHTTLGAKDLLYGLTLNNSPTVGDIWNSTPAWRYPWLSSGSAPSPSAQPLIEGALAQDVAGLGAYTMWNNHLYADFSLYRSAHLGGPQPLTGKDFTYNIHGVAPYWRLAWQQTWGLNYLEVGTYGIHVSSIPGGVSGRRDTYTDPAVDLQYERPFGVDLLTVHATYIHETSHLDATFASGGATEPSHHLNTFRANATYHLRSRYEFTLAGFSTTGNADPILFAPAPVTGSALGSPNSGGFIGQAGYWPKQNIELTAAYTAYTKFNGASHNYDGSGRNASANNSVYIALWLNF